MHFPGYQLCVSFIGLTVLLHPFDSNVCIPFLYAHLKGRIMLRGWPSVCPSVHQFFWFSDINLKTAYWIWIKLSMCVPCDKTSLGIDFGICRPTGGSSHLVAKSKLGFCMLTWKLLVEFKSNLIWFFHVTKSGLGLIFAYVRLQVAPPGGKV